jgi:hypothetical protein
MDYGFRNVSFPHQLSRARDIAKQNRNSNQNSQPLSALENQLKYQSPHFGSDWELWHNGGDPESFKDFHKST